MTSFDSNNQANATAKSAVQKTH